VTPTAPAVAADPTLPSVDELVTTALERLYDADKALNQPLTVARIHVIRGHIAAARAALLTKPLRPGGVAE
jgi:hypothetical protein